MRTRLLIIVILLFLASSSNAATRSAAKKAVSKPKPVPAAPIEWAAKVNGNIVSMDLYNRVWNASKKELSKKISIEADEEAQIYKATRKAILEQMIEGVILQQWAQREGIEIKAQSVKTKIDEIKKAFPSTQEFHRSLAEQGMSVDDLERDVRKQLIAESLINAKAKALAVTDEEIRSFYDKNIELYQQNEKVHLFQMSFKERKDAELQKAKLDSGEKFEGAEDLGFVDKNQVPQNAPDVFTMKPGQTTNVVSSEDGYYILRVEEWMPGKETKFRDVKDNIRKFLLREKARTKYLKDLQEEKMNAKIIINEKLMKLF
jgi:parvulin-like peptidyl-prolyl isomerase